MAIAAGRLPHSLILGGPAGAGKYTLAIMLTMALECERQPRELWSTGQSLASYCGVCKNCTRIGSAIDLQTLIDAAVETREGMRETDKKETRILIQQHPDVLIVPPDPPQLLIKVGQMRTLINSAQYLPSEAPRKVFILSSANFMKEAANSLLKVLEEPPDYAHIILCAEDPGELLPTIRSRCAIVRLGALPLEELEMLLADKRPDWTPKHRALVSRLSQGAAGKALTFDLERYTAARADAMLLLRSALADPDHSDLFKMTETYRAGADGQVKTTALHPHHRSAARRPSPATGRNPRTRPQRRHPPRTRTARLRQSRSRGSKTPAARSTRSRVACVATSCATSRSTPSPSPSPPAPDLQSEHGP